ncbi:MAG: redoxin domain-containing protein [Pirellulales bacterium]
MSQLATWSAANGQQLFRATLALAVGCAVTVLGSWTATAAESATGDASPEAAVLGRQIENFTLADYRGKEHSLADLADRKLVVLAFLGTECPLAKLYGPRLAELAEQYEPQGVAFLGVDSNRQDSVTEIAAYARLHGIEFPLLKDLSNRLADQAGAERTPEVFLLDENRKVRYHGRIDDQYGFSSGSGYAKPMLARRDLADAIDDLLAGHEVRVASTPVAGCLIGRVLEVQSGATVTYSNQIARILQKHCIECHRPGEIAPFSLTAYDEVVGWAEMIEEVTRDRRMPPWHASPEFGHFKNDRRLSDDELDAITAWVKSGAPEGNPSDLPAPITFNEGWGISGPDMVVYMSEESYQVPAEGTVEYQYFTVDPGFTEDKWVCASECRAGNRAVVHHIFVFVQPPGTEEVSEMAEARRDSRATGEVRPQGAPDLSGRSGGVRLMSGTAPGVPPFKQAKGMAFHVPAGSKLVFQMHYTPNGTEQFDRSCVGLNFCPPEEVTAAINMNMAINPVFTIPAGADNHEVESWHKFNRDSLMLSLTPHMHLRGKSFRYELIYPDGRTETILDVPRYDFNWQLTYQLAEPLHVPAGTKLHCTAHFDNSEDNLANPDATQPVRWGDQTWEEMMIGWFAETSDLEADPNYDPRTRTAQFERELADGKVKFSSRVEKQAARALGAQKSFDIFARLVTDVMPQIDRVDVAKLTDDGVRFPMISQPSLLVARLGRGDVTLPADSALAAALKSPETIVYNSYPTGVPADLVDFARGIHSSVHVPVTVDGQPVVVSFWSREPGAFGPQAVELLTGLASHVGRPTETAQNDAE